jgi:hypothetical protein
VNLVRTLCRRVCVPLAVVAAFPIAAVAGSDCTFKKKVQKWNYVFNVSSRPVGDCSIQVVRIAVQRSGRPLTQFANDPDVLAEEAWAEDLDDDDKPELVVVSRSPKDAARVTLDVYRLDGNMIRRVQPPELAERTGYRGRDSYRLDGSQILRTFPVYRDGDADDAPGGGTRTLRYGLRDRQLVALDRQGEPAPSTSSTAPPSPPAAAATTGKTAPRPVVRGIVAGPSAIDIQVDGTIGRVRTFRLPGPERLIIDIPAAVSALRANVAAIGRFGINRARAGAHDGYFRVVLDATVTPFPAYTVTTSDAGLRIEFAPAADQRQPAPRSTQRYEP